MPRSLTPLPLAAKTFAPYGDVIEVTADAPIRTINDGNAQRFHDLAALTLEESGGKASINIFRVTPLSMPVTLKVMERHPLSSQTFVPLSDQPFLVAVAPAGDLKPNAISVFLAKPSQGVNYHPGTWHHYCLALNELSDFLVVDRVADDENCNEIRLAESDWISIDLTGLSDS